jgi:hypothetical protein
MGRGHHLFHIRVFALNYISTFLLPVTTGVRTLMLTCDIDFVLLAELAQPDCLIWRFKI